VSMGFGGWASIGQVVGGIFGCGLDGVISLVWGDEIGILVLWIWIWISFVTWDFVWAGALHWDEMAHLAQEPHRQES